METDDDEWHWTRHSIERALDMAISADELRRGVRHPEATYPSRKYAGCILYCCGRFTLAVNEPEKVVITVLWNIPDRYDRDNDLHLVRDREGDRGGRQ